MPAFSAVLLDCFSREFLETNWSLARKTYNTRERKYSRSCEYSTVSKSISNSLIRVTWIGALLQKRQRTYFRENTFAWPMPQPGSFVWCEWNYHAQTAFMGLPFLLTFSPTRGDLSPLSKSAYQGLSSNGKHEVNPIEARWVCMTHAIVLMLHSPWYMQKNLSTGLPAST